MRTIFTLTLILLVAAFAVAQQGTTSPSAPDANSPMQNPSQARPGLPSGQSATPDQASPMGGTDMVEGCLGGSNPNYTVTDKSGKSYQILVPQGADASPLAKHIGESVRVEGTIDSAAKSDSAAAPDSGAAPGASPGTASSRSIHAMRIGRGTSTCPTAGPSSSPKPGGSSTPPTPPSQ